MTEIVFKRVRTAADKSKGNNMTAMPNKIRYCVVKTCRNNSRICPTKIFISTKTSWYSIIGRKELSKNSCFFICEDHFNLKDDASNWMAYSTFSRFLRLKKDVVPHLFLDTPSTVPLDYSQLGSRHYENRQRTVDFISCRPAEHDPEDEDARAETDPLSIDDDPARNAQTGENVNFLPKYQDVDHTEDVEMREVCDTSYDLLELSYGTGDDAEIPDDELIEDTKPNVQVLDAEMNFNAAEDEGSGSNRDENIEIFLKYLGTKLRRIDEERLRDKVEAEILAVVQKYVSRSRDRKGHTTKTRINVNCLDKEKLRIIINDHNYGSVLWLSD